MIKSIQQKNKPKMGKKKKLILRSSHRENNLDDDLKTKKQSIDNNNYHGIDQLCEDEIFHILEFVDTNFLISVGMILSEQFYRTALKIPKNIKIISGTGLESVMDRMKSPHLRNITELSFFFVRSIERAEQTILFREGYENLKNLTCLLIMSSLTKAGLKYISESFANLTDLGLYYNSIGDDDIRFIVDSKILKNLKILELANCELHQEGARLLSLSENMKNLTKLNVMDNLFGDNGLKYIADSLYLMNLTHLNAMRNDIGDKGIIALSQSKNLSRLRFLSLMGNYRIGNEGVKSLVYACGVNFQRLQILELGQNSITDEGAKYFLHNDNIFNNLLELDLSHTRIHEMQQKIPEKLPNLKIFSYGMNEVIKR